MVLVAMIDDATSRVLARFYPAETTKAYMDLLGRYLRQYGRMVAMYVDGDSIFRAEDHDPQDRQPKLTQFKRALEELEIGLIPAGSSPYGERVERFNKTAQDRPPYGGFKRTGHFYLRLTTENSVLMPASTGPRGCETPRAAFARVLLWSVDRPSLRKSMLTG
jgi:hypothetical protein